MCRCAAWAALTGRVRAKRPTPARRRPARWRGARLSWVLFFLLGPIDAGCSGGVEDRAECPALVTVQARGAVELRGSTSLNRADQRGFMPAFDLLPCRHGCGDRRDRPGHDEHALSPVR